MPQLFSNDSSARLLVDISSTDTSVTVPPGEGDRFPLPDPGDPESYSILTIEDDLANFEIVKMTERTGDVLTIERGLELTTPQGFAKDVSRIELRLTAGALNEFVQKSEQHLMRGEDVEMDGARFWHQQDPASYQYFTLRYYTLDFFGAQIMAIEPPAGIPDLNIMGGVTAADGSQRNFLLGRDVNAQMPGPAAGQVKFQIPGVLAFGAITNPLFSPLGGMHFDEFVTGGGTAYRLQAFMTGTSAIRFTWTCRDDTGAENWASFMEQGQLSCNWAIEVRNKDRAQYTDAVGVNMGVSAHPWWPGEGDWCVWNASDQSASRTLTYTFMTRAIVPGSSPVEYRDRSISIHDGLVLCDNEPTEGNHLANKDYVDLQIGSAIAGEGLDVIAAAIYGRTGLYDNAAGLSPGQRATLTGGNKFSDFHSIEVTMVDSNGTEFVGQTIDTQTLANKGTDGTAKWVVYQAIDHGDDVRHGMFVPFSDTTFEIQYGPNGGSAKLVRIIGTFPKATTVSSSSGGGSSSAGVSRTLRRSPVLRLPRVTTVEG